MKDININDFIKHRDELIINIKNLEELLSHERKMLEELTPENFPQYYLKQAKERRERNIDCLRASLEKNFLEWDIFYDENCK